MAGAKEASELPAKRKFTGGQLTGLVMMGLAIVIPGFFWALAYWRDLTNTYCEGECATGWMAVVSTFLAIPAFAIGAATLGIATAIKSGKAAKKAAARASEPKQSG